MKDRLLRILQEERMTSNKFAELMEVRPSNISHLLSGRNYPNFEFIGRMLKRFPNLNPDWLINGDGDMVKDSNLDLFCFPSEKVVSKELSEGTLVVNNQSNQEAQAQPIFEQQSSEVLNPLKSTDKPLVPMDLGMFTNVNTEKNSFYNVGSLETSEQPENQIEDDVSTHNDTISVVNKCENDIKKPKPSIKMSDGIERIIVFYDDKTFDVYNSRTV